MPCCRCSQQGCLLLTVVMVILLVAAGVVMLMSQAHLSLRITRQEHRAIQQMVSIGRMSMRRDQHGFSLMELLLVLVSVIVAMAVPAWRHNQLAAGRQQAWMQLHRIGLQQ